MCEVWEPGGGTSLNSMAALACLEKWIAWGLPAKFIMLFCFDIVFSDACFSGVSHSCCKLFVLLAITATCILPPPSR